MTPKKPRYRDAAIGQVAGTLARRALEVVNSPDAAPLRAAARAQVQRLARELKRDFETVRAIARFVKGDKRD
jgi:hypothetical protein